jgi:hypothetical protein
MTQALSFLGVMLLAIGRPEMWARDSLIRREEKWWQNALAVLGLALMVLSNLRSCYGV